MSPMRTGAATTDEDLLASCEREAFGVFYDRHVRALLGYFARRTGDPEVAADLTAETFASAIASQRRYSPAHGSAVAWLYTIATRRLADYHRRGTVERRMRRALALERPPLGGEDAEMIRLLGESAAATLLAGLPSAQGDAVAAHVVDDRGYAELAHTLSTSEAVVRKRVVVITVHVGGIPQGAAFDAGSLWIADLHGRFVRLDLRTRRVTAEIPVKGRPIAVAAGPAGIWGRVERSRELLTSLVRIDPATGRAVAGVAEGGGATGAPTVAVGASAIWVVRDYPSLAAIDRVDSERVRVTDRIRPFASGRTVASAGDTAWALMGNGSLVHLDDRGRVVRRWTALAPGGALAADSDGVWALSTDKAQIMRVTGGRVVHRIPVAARVRPLLASGPDGLWIAVGDAVRGRNELLRIDPVSGRVTARIALGHHIPSALVSSGDTLAVVTDQGDVLLVSTPR